MSRTLVMRATSLAASAGLLVLIIAGAFSATYTVQQLAKQETPAFASFADPPPAPTPIARPKSLPLNPHPQTAAADPTEAANDPRKPTETTFEPTPPAPPIIVDPRWLQVPRDLARYYPARAAEAEVEGSATLDCLVEISGRLDCSLVSETPPDWGFGRAAMRIAQDYRMAPALRAGQPVEARYRMRVPFLLN
jgi:protein TonB